MKIYVELDYVDFNKIKRGLYKNRIHGKEGKEITRHTISKVIFLQMIKTTTLIKVCP